MHPLPHRLIAWFGSAALIAAAVVVSRPPSGASAATGDCFLDVPQHPLSASGLASPYLLRGDDCHENVAATAAFVEATILDPATGDLSTYKPLVIDAGTAPAVKPTLPTLPDGAVVGIVFGFNGNSLTLLSGVSGALAEGHCVNGLPGSIFGQVSYCNSIEFYAAANRSVRQGLTHVPPRAKGADGEICPTPWSFSIVDQDPVDNTDTTYLVTATGRLMQNTEANKLRFPTAHLAGNPSDFRLTEHFVDAALKCSVWQIRDLTDTNPSAVAPSQHTDSLQARFTRSQGQDANTAAIDESTMLARSELLNAPGADENGANVSLRVALVPLGDPMTKVDGAESLLKVNLYRENVDQPQAGPNGAKTKPYCLNMLQIGLPRVALDRPLTVIAASPDPAAANSLFTFLGNRFQASWVLLECANLTGLQNPITLETNGAGVVTDVKINLKPPRNAAPASLVPVPHTAARS